MAPTRAPPFQLVGLCLVDGEEETVFWRSDEATRASKVHEGEVELEVYGGG